MHAEPHHHAKHRALPATASLARHAGPPRHGADPEAGDVPGWVMVTLMSALMVAGVYAVAGPALIDLFNNALGTIGGMK